MILFSVKNPPFSTIKTKSTILQWEPACSSLLLHSLFHRRHISISLLFFDPPCVFIIIIIFFFFFFFALFPFAAIAYLLFCLTH